MRADLTHFAAAKKEQKIYGLAPSGSRATGVTLPREGRLPEEIRRADQPRYSPCANQGTSNGLHTLYYLTALKLFTQAMSYREIASVVRDWTGAHALTLKTCWAGGDMLCADLSSSDGQSFRIAIDRPLNGVAGVHLVCMEGWTQNDPRQNWVAEVSDVREALDEALAEVLKRMKLKW